MTEPSKEQVTSEVFVTAELARRQAKPKDWTRAKRVIEDLTAQLSEDPNQLLPRFVQLAMEMTGGSTAGLSLLEMEPAPGVFRWHHLLGKLASFNGATTPRNYSPCGITLDQAAPVLVQCPERIYQWLADANIGLAEVLLVPLFLGGPEPLGTLWIVADSENHFDSGDARIATELADFVGMVLRMQRNRERLRNALDTREALTRDVTRWQQRFPNDATTTDAN